MKENDIDKLEELSTYELIRAIAGCKEFIKIAIEELKIRGLEPEGDSYVG